MVFVENWLWSGETTTLEGGVEVFSIDVVVLQFTTAMKNNDALLNVDNYTITETDDNSVSLPIFKVYGTNQEATYNIFITVGDMKIGTDYTLTINVSAPNLKRTDDTSIPSSEATQRFFGRRTKFDNYFEKSQVLYDMERNTAIRTLMESILRQDDLIGGNRNDRLE